MNLHPPLLPSGAMPHLLRATFQAWELYVTKAYVQSLETENERLRTLVKKKSESIWEMTKADLVEVARRELGMTKTQAEKDTVIILREKIRRNREVVAEAQDPMLVLPKGLQRMNHADLLLEMERRNLPIPENPTRPMMILMIKEQVDFLSQTAATSQETNPPTSETTSEMKEEDWMKVDSERTTRRR